MENFLSYNLKEKTLKAIENVFFKKPTKTQQLVLPDALANKNLACKGKTGSGKTHCFLIPIADKIDEQSKTLQALILVPTRELAVQTTQRAKDFFKDYDIKVACLTGGVDTLREKNRILTTPQILIGTPEKICEIAVANGLLNLSQVKTFVIDEADMTLEMGFLNEVDKVASLCKNAQMMIFSATIPVGIRQFIRKYFSNPLVIEDEKVNYNDQIEHILYPTRGKNKNDLLLSIINHLNPYICLIFASKKEEVDNIYEYLTNHDVECGIIHGDLTARERKANIKRALDGKYRFIVCSDIAARGIDIDGASHIINMEFPTELDFYIHRSGRCGRGKYTGECYSMYDTTNQQIVQTLEKKGITFEMKELKGNQFVDTKDREKRKSRVKHQTELEKKITSIVKKPTKVKPGYKKKRQRQIDEMVRKEKRQIIKQDIRRQKKERAKAAQRAKRESEE